MRRKSESEKKSQGTSREDRRKEKSGTVYVGRMPPPPNYLDTRGRAIYKEIFEHVKSNGFQKVDRFIISSTAYCLCRIEKLRWLLEESDGNGEIQEYSSGAKNVSAEFTALLKLESQFFSYSDRLGLDVKSREKLLSFEPEKEEDIDPVNTLRKIK